MIHLQLHAWWRIDVEVTGYRDEKARSDPTSFPGSLMLRPQVVVWTTTVGLKTIHNLPLTRSRKPKDVEIVRAGIKLMNSVLVRIKCLDPEFCNWQTVEDASFATHENRSIYKIFVCFNCSTSFRSDDSKNSTKEVRLLRNDILSLKLKDC